MDDLLTLTADIVGAHVANNTVAASDLPTLIKTTYDSLATLGQSPVPESVALEPAVSIKASVKPDFIVCLEDGKKFKTIKRHIASDHGMTPAEYRAKWGLKSDYPMTAPAYTATRKALALKSGLGRKPSIKTPEAPAKAAPKTRGRKAAPAPKTANGSKPATKAPAKTPRKSAKAALAASRERLG